MTLKALIFDLDDTLIWDERSVKEAFQATCHDASRYAVVDPEALELAVRKQARLLYESFDTYAFTQMIGINPFEALWAHFTEGEDESFRKLQQLAPQYRKDAWTRGLLAVGIDQPMLGLQLAELFPEERRSRPLVYEETYAVLDQLKDQYQLLLLTNGSPDLQKEKIASFPRLRSYFDHIVISGEFGEGKPATSIFKHTLSLAQVDAHEAIMIGDKLTTDITGSHQMHMTNIWINHHHIHNNGHIQPIHEVSRLNEIIPIIATYGNTNTH